MKFYKSSLLAIGLTVLVGCGGGGGSNTTEIPTPIVENLSKTTLVYSQSPTINEELKLSIEDNTEDVTTGYTWEITSEPTTSNLQLNVSANSKSLLLTPAVAGQYKLTATPTTGEAIETQFSVAKSFPFNVTKLQGSDSTQELSKRIGIVTNQVWVYSKTLNQAAIERIVSNYQGFTILDFDEIRGLLLEYDETLAQANIDINQIKSVSGIDSVDPRVFEGKDYIRPLHKVANDGSAFDDGGDNWHLEHIGIETAWDISTGNNDFPIGILDGADFHTQHEDLRGRFKEATKALFDSEKNSHGTAVSGAIGAISNNNKGMSGINWSNQLIAKEGGYNQLEAFVKRGDVFLMNMSLGLVPEHIINRFDPSNAASVEETNKFSLAQTSDFRKLADNKPGKLFIFSAGNGIKNGLGNDDGIFGVDGRHADPSLHYIEKEGVVVLEKKSNVMFVAAHTISNKLIFYSNYGESVDIAAPTNYKSTKNDNSTLESFESLDEYYTADEYATNRGGGFTGTSAAAPVVTGVASLIFAADPTLTVANVKTILIKSATNFITERYNTPFIDENGNFDTDILTHPIPVLNAGSALTMTKEIVDSREIIVDHKFSNPFVSTVNVNVATANENIPLESFDYKVNVRNNGALEELLSGTVAGFSPLVFQNLDPDKTNYVITGTTNTPAHEPTGISLNSNFNYEFIVAKVNALTSNKTTQASIPNVSIDIKSDDGSLPLTSGVTDANGSSRLYLTPGKYNILAKADGYKDLISAFTLKETDLGLDVILELEPNTTEPGTGEAGENLQPITSLTNSETITIPVSSIPNISSLTITTQSGFDGSIDGNLSLIGGVSSINAVDIQRNIGLSVDCIGEATVPFIIGESDFSTGIINETVYIDGLQVASCSANFQSVLPLTLTNSNIDILPDWGDGGFLSTCPSTELPAGTEPPTVNTECSTIITTNYLITDENGVEHKISTRLTNVANE